MLEDQNKLPDNVLADLVSTEIGNTKYDAIIKLTEACKLMVECRQLIDVKVAHDKMKNPKINTPWSKHSTEIYNRLQEMYKDLDQMIYTLRAGM